MSCDQNGIANCDTCKGAGIIVEFIRLTREFSLQNSEGHFFPDSTPKSLHNDIPNSNEWQVVARGSLNDSYSVPNQWQHIQFLVRNLVSSIEQSCGSYSKSICYRYTVTGVPVFYLEGTIEGLQASAWLVGECGNPQFEIDPFTQRCQQFIDAAIQEWTQGKPDQAVVTLRRAVRMSKRWAPCRLILESARTIPQDLLKKARTPQALQATMDAASSLGKWLFGGAKTSPDQSKSGKQDSSSVEQKKKSDRASKQKRASKPPVKPVAKTEGVSTTEAPPELSGIKGFVEVFKRGWSDGTTVHEWQPPSEATQQNQGESNESFAPPKNWKYQCPRCGVVVEDRVGVCWNCNLDTVMQKRR